MAFIDEKHRVFRQIFEQGRRRLAFLTPRQIARIVFDPRASPRCGDHFQIENRTFAQALFFQQFTRRQKFLAAFLEIALDLRRRLIERRFRRHIMAVRIEFNRLKLFALFARQRIDLDHFLNLIPEHHQAPGDAFQMRGENFDRVAFDAKIAAPEGDVVALVLQIDQRGEKRLSLHLLPLHKSENHPLIGFSRADAVNAGHRRHDNHIVAFQQRARRRMAHAVELFIHHGFFFDIGVRARDIGFGLIVIVIADEIFDGVIREKRFHFSIQLRRQCFIGRKDQRRALQRLNCMRDGKGFAGSCDAQ